MLAAQLNELGVVQPEAPPRNNRSSKTTNSGNGQTPHANNNNGSGNAQSQNLAQNHATAAVIDDDSDTDSEPEDSGRVRNDGTLLASDPPKPL